MKYEALKDKLEKDGIKYFDIEIDGGYECILKQIPTKTTLKKVLSLVKNDYVSAIYLLIKELWVEGDKEILEDSDLFLSLLDIKTDIIKTTISIPIEVGEDEILDDETYQIEGKRFKDKKEFVYETLVETLLKVYPANFIKLGNTIAVSIDGFNCNITKPKISDLGLLFKALEKNPLDATDLVLKDFWISGDDELKDSKYFLSMNAVIGEILNKRAGSLKKN